MTYNEIKRALAGDCDADIGQVDYRAWYVVGVLMTTEGFKSWWNRHVSEEAQDRLFEMIKASIVAR